MKKIAAFAFAATVLSTAAYAAPAKQKSTGETEYLTGTLGWYDLIDQDDQAMLGGVEYRFMPIGYGVRPMVGVFGTTDSAVYGYAGLHWDIKVTDQFYISPNFAAGLYGQGDGKDLGGAIEFRSGIELGYQMANRHRIGLSLNHLSNASIYDKNPGVETLIMTYSLPTGNIF